MDEFLRAWARLAPSTQEWMIAHNGEPLPPDVVAELLNTAGGGDRPGWLVFSDGGEVELSDDAVDCVEAIANDEDPADDSGR